MSDDQIHRQAKPQEEKLASMDAALKTLRGHLKTGKPVEIAGKTYSPAELKDMADRVMEARKACAGQLAGLHESQGRLQKVAQSVHRIATATPHPMPKIDVEKAIAWIEGKLAIKLAALQQEAIRQACQQKILVITGGPGVGKTTLVRSILEIFRAKKMKCVLAAPTGRAAKRMAETTGQTAKTIHRLLEFDPATGDFKRNQQHPLTGDRGFIDEEVRGYFEFDAKGYWFTSPSIAKALVEVHKRGVKVEVILDRSRTEMENEQAEFIVQNGVPTFIDDKHTTAHNKLIIIDGNVAITGSFNFTDQSENENAENLLVIRDKGIADKFTANWKAHAEHSGRYGKQAQR